LVTLVASSLLLRAVGVGGLLDPWNPWLAAPAVAWFCFLAWDLASGHRWSLPLAVAIGSLAVQAHLGVAVVVAALGATAVLLVAFGPGRDREAADGPRWARVVLVSAVVAAVLWAPTVVEQATGDPGNSRQILSFFLGDGSDGATTYFGTPAEPTGWHDGLAVLSRETVGPAPWLGGAEPRTLLGAVEGRSPVLLAVPVGLLLVTAFVGRRLRRPELWIAAVLGGVAMAAAAVSVARILGEPFDYLVRWVWPIALFVHVMAAWSVVLAVRAREEARIRLPDRRPAMAWTAVGLLLVVSTMSLDAGAGADGPHSAWESAVASLAPPAVAWAEDHDDGPVLVRSDGALVIIPPAIVLALDRAHQDVVVDESLAGVLPDYRHRQVDATTTLVLAGPEATARLDRDRRAVRLADDPGDPSSDAMPPIALFAIEAP
jgi:hypothetical protein